MQVPGPWWSSQPPVHGFYTPECFMSPPGFSPALSFLPQPGPITEVDGAVASDFFTVLSTGQHFTEDQWLNMQAFSMLRKWLLHSGPEDPGSPDAGVPRLEQKALRGKEHRYAVARVRVRCGQDENHSVCGPSKECVEFGG